MTRTMYDSTTPGDLPADGDLYAAYMDGRYRNVDQVRARFPGRPVVTITVRGGVADVADVETGAMTVASAVRWVRQRRDAGGDPTVYTLVSWWQTCRSAFSSAGTREPHWWIAHYDNQPVLPAGAVAKQYGGDLPGHYDCSVVADYWPGVDPTTEELSMVTQVAATHQGVPVPIGGLAGSSPVTFDHRRSVSATVAGQRVWQGPALDGSLVVYSDPAGLVDVAYTQVAGVGLVVAAGATLVASTFGAVVVAVSTVDPSAWTTGGIGSAAVGSLLYLIKRMTDGSLVSVKVEDLIAQSARREDDLRHEAERRDEALRAIASHVDERAEEREQKLREVAQRGQDREDLLWTLLRGKGTP